MQSYFKNALAIREKLIQNNKVLCVDFPKTTQKQDIRKELIQDVNTNTYPYRVHSKVKYFEDPSFDPKKEALIHYGLTKEFDTPLWFLKKAKDKLKNIALYSPAFIYQIMGCNFHDGSNISGCQYCYVDNESNFPSDKGVFLSIDDILTGFKNSQLKVLVTSGGEPTLALDHILLLYKEMKKRSIPILSQFDTNLSTGRIIERFEHDKIYEKNILEKISQYDPKVLVAFKGTDNESISENTKTDLTLEDQIYSLKKFVKAKIDVYPYIYNPNPKTIKQFIKKLEKHFKNITPKIHIGKIHTYTPTKTRLCYDSKALEEQQNQWEFNYIMSCNILDSILYKNYKLNYKQLERPSIQIKLKK